MFSSKNLSGEDIVNNQISVIGAPSIPVYNNYANPIESIDNALSGINQNIEFTPLPIPAEGINSWDEELINMKYNSNAKVAFNFLDASGMAIGDSVEMYINN